MASARFSLFAAAAFSLTLGFLQAAPDATKLREQLELATTGDDTLSRIEILRRLLDADPTDAASHRLLIELWLGVKDYDMAEATLNAWPEAPADLSALTRAAILRHRDNNIPGAASVLREYLAKSPRDIPAHEALVSALLATQDFAAQVAALDALIALKRDAANLIQRANAKLRAGDFTGALADAQAAQALEPEAEVVKGAMPAFERLQEALAALPPLDAALAANPQDFPKLLERAWWLRYGNVLARSLADADAAVAIAPDSLAARITRARVRYLLDQLKAEDALRDELIDVGKAHAIETLLAIAAGDAALAKNPKDAAQLRNRAHALNEAEQYLLAQRDAEAALALAPKDVAAGLEALFATALLGQDPAPALRRLEVMKPSKMQLALANGYVADYYLRQSNLPLALEFADRSLALQETAYQLRVKAAALQRLGRAEEAAAATHRANAIQK
jgi:tetratricopeptide (TPR) repeat protein